MVKNGCIDAVKKYIKASQEKAKILVDVDTVKHTEAREIGAKWICLQTIRELGIDKILEKQGWSEVKITHSTCPPYNTHCLFSFRTEINAHHG